MPDLVDDGALAALLEAINQASGQEIGPVDAMLAHFPEDARLHFLRGSLLAGSQRYIEAHGALKRAVELAPDYAIARFQLGFFQLTSGETAQALETWGRLDALADGHYLRKFVEGLRCLVRDDFLGAINTLSEGIGANTENPPLNNDMQLIIDRCRPLLGGPLGEEPASETALILQQFTQQRRPMPGPP